MAKTRIALEPQEQHELNRRVRTSTVPVRDRQRAQIILLAAQGHTQQAIGAAVGLSRVSVNHWCRRFARQRLAGLMEASDEAASPRCRKRR